MAILRYFWLATHPDKKIVEAEQKNAKYAQQFEDEVRVSTLESTVTASRHLLATPQLPSPTLTAMIPLPRNERFFGREILLHQLHSYVGNPAAEPQSRQKSCVLHGVGGSGKSSLALEYCYRFRSSYKYSFWVCSEHTEELADSYARIAATLFPNHSSHIQQNLITEAHGWLSTTGAVVLAAILSAASEQS